MYIVGFDIQPYKPGRCQFDSLTEYVNYKSLVKVGLIN